MDGRAALFMIVAVGLPLLGSATLRCAPFQAMTDIASGDAALDASEASAIAPRIRTLRVELDIPTAEALDPLRDARAVKMFVTAVHTRNPGASKTVEISRDAFGAARAVELREFSSTELVDIFVHVRALDDQLVGYGERRGADVDASTTIQVALRKRLLYVSDESVLSAHDLASAGKGEPAFSLDAIGPEMTSLRSPTGMYLTRDALRLVQTGVVANAPPSTPGGLQVVSTASHARIGELIPLSFVPNRVAPIGDGHLALVVPDEGAGVLGIVDIDARTTTFVPVVTGRKWTGSSISVAPDGARAAIAAELASVQSTPPAPRILLVDLAKAVANSPDAVTAIDPGGVEAVRGVRFSADGQRLFVAGYKDGMQGKTGVVDVWNAAATERISRALLEQDKTLAGGLVLHPDGKHAYVVLEDQYPGGTGCCGGMSVFDLDSQKEVFRAKSTIRGGEYGVFSAVRLPYLDHRVIGGQTGPQNNVTGPIVDMTSGGAAPKPMDIRGTNETIFNLATPFGTQL